MSPSKRQVPAVESRNVRSAGNGERRDRSRIVLAGAVGLLLGALLMNLTSPPVQVVQVTGRGDSTGAGDEALGTAGSPGIGEDALADGTGSGPGGTSSGGGLGEPGRPASTVAEPSPGSAIRVRGVTDSTVKLGFSFFNVGFYDVIPAYDVGPGLEKMNAVLQRWRREGRDVMHGRKIQLVYAEYSITDEETQRAACLTLLNDAKVFAVAAPAGMYAGTDCVTKEKKTPLVQTASTGGTAKAVRERAPYFFMVAPDRSQTSRNWAHWAHRRGILKGKRIGFYYSEDEAAELEDHFIPELRRLGYGKSIVVEATATDDEVGPEDTVAVNQFQLEDVNLAVLLLNGLRMENFMQQAESRGYHPQYIASDLGVNTDDTKTTTFSPTQWDKTFAMTSMMYGGRGQQLAGEAKICMADYNRQGRNPQPGTAEFNYALMSCHALEVAWRALHNAGRNLTVDSYIRGMENIKNYAGAFNPGTSFSASDHTGSDMQRTLQWHSSCGCYQVVTKFEPFYVP